MFGSKKKTPTPELVDVVSAIESVEAARKKLNEEVQARLNEPFEAQTLLKGTIAQQLRNTHHKILLATRGFGGSHSVAVDRGSLCSEAVQALRAEGFTVEAATKDTLYFHPDPRYHPGETDFDRTRYVVVSWGTHLALKDAP